MSCLNYSLCQVFSQHNVRVASPLEECLQFGQLLRGKCGAVSSLVRDLRFIKVFDGGDGDEYDDSAQCSLIKKSYLATAISEHFRVGVTLAVSCYWRRRVRY